MAQRQEARWQAQEAQQVEAQFGLTDKSIGLLYDHNINIEKYQEKHDKPIVQHAANEAIDIFNQAAEIKEQDVVPLEFLDLAVTTTDKGFDQVYNGNLQGFDLIECGHAFCAYGEAVVKGITLGIWDTAKGLVIDHPMQTTMMIIAPEGYFAYQLGKITYKLAGTGLLYVFNPEKGKKDWEDNYLKPIKEIISVLASNEVPGPEKVGIVTRVGTGFAAEYLLTKKLRKAYKKLITDPRLDSLKKGIVDQLTKAEKYVNLVKPGTSNVLKEFSSKLLETYHDHIFSDYHVENGIMKLGKNKEAIKKIFMAKILEADALGKLQNNILNQMVTQINGYETVVKVFIENGKALSIDGYILNKN